jgi:hypothetical protein
MIIDVNPFKDQWAFIYSLSSMDSLTVYSLSSMDSLTVFEGFFKYSYTVYVNYVNQ